MGPSGTVVQYILQFIAESKNTKMGSIYYIRPRDHKIRSSSRTFFRWPLPSRRVLRRRAQDTVILHRFLIAEWHRDVWVTFKSSGVDTITSSLSVDFLPPSQSHIFMEKMLPAPLPTHGDSVLNLSHVQLWQTRLSLFVGTVTVAGLVPPFDEVLILSSLSGGWGEGK